jgi:hypothetical protein
MDIREHLIEFEIETKDFNIKPLPEAVKKRLEMKYETFSVKGK